MSKQAQPGQVVRLLEEGGGCNFAMTQGKLYYIYALSDCGEGSNFHDDKGNQRCFWAHDKYEIVSDLQAMQEAPAETLLDIKGNTVSVGDTVAYADRGNLKLFEVTQIGRGTAMVKADDGVVLRVGCFNERAIKIK